MKWNANIILLSCLISVSACQKEEYYYPSVLTEFVDIETNSTGRLSFINRDNGENYEIAERSGLEGFAHDSIYRAVSIFEPIKDTNDNITAKLYSCKLITSVIPSTEDKFTNGIKTDPLNIDRIWQSGDYINMILEIMAKDKPHGLNFIENEITDDADGSKTLYLTVYHNQNGDYEAFTKKVYASIPLWPYRNVLSEGDKVIVNINTYKEGKTKREFYF